MPLVLILMPSIPKNDDEGLVITVTAWRSPPKTGEPQIRQKGNLSRFSAQTKRSSSSEIPKKCLKEACCEVEGLLMQHCFG